MTDEDGAYVDTRHWYMVAYFDAYLSFYKPQILQEIADAVFRENPILKHMREAGIERQRNREAFQRALTVNNQRARNDYYKNRTWK